MLCGKTAFGKRCADFILGIGWKFFPDFLDTGDLKLSDKDFNYNTLEPKILKENGREAMNNIFGTNYDTDDEMHKYMHAHKTDCAIAIFESATKIKYPEYIMRAIKNE